MGLPHICWKEWMLQGGMAVFVVSPCMCVKWRQMNKLTGYGRVLPYIVQKTGAYWHGWVQNGESASKEGLLRLCSEKEWSVELGRNARRWGYGMVPGRVGTERWLRAGLAPVTYRERMD